MATTVLFSFVTDDCEEVLLMVILLGILNAFMEHISTHHSHRHEDISRLEM